MGGVSIKVAIAHRLKHYFMATSIQTRRYKQDFVHQQINPDFVQVFRPY